MKNELKPTNGALHLDQNYKHFLSSIKERLQTAQIRAEEKWCFEFKKVA